MYTTTCHHKNIMKTIAKKSVDEDDRLYFKMLTCQEQSHLHIYIYMFLYCHVPLKYIIIYKKQILISE